MHWFTFHQRFWDLKVPSCLCRTWSTASYNPCQPVARSESPTQVSQPLPCVSSAQRLMNFVSSPNWLWLLRFQNISRPVGVILYLNYLNAIYLLKQFPLHWRSVFFFRNWSMINKWIKTCSCVSLLKKHFSGESLLPEILELIIFPVALLLSIKNNQRPESQLFFFPS